LTWDIDEGFDELGQDKAGIENNVIELLEAIFAKQFPGVLNLAENNDKGLEYVCGLSVKVNVPRQKSC
jgi:hypothetical protein